MSSASGKKILAIVPAYNESASISQVILALKSCLFIDHIVVVDDGSTDGTYDVVKKYDVTVLKNVDNQGVGSALRRGFEYALDNEFDLTVQFDADGQHQTSEIEKLLEKAIEFDITVGSRFTHHGILNGDYTMSSLRRQAILFLNKITSMYVGTKLRDSTSGFRVCNQNAIQLFAFKMPSYYLGDTIESLFIAKNAGLRIGEAEIMMENRKVGQPSHGSLKSLARYFYLFGRLSRFLIRTKFLKSHNQ